MVLLINALRASQVHAVPVSSHVETLTVKFATFVGERIAMEKDMRELKDRWWSS